MATKQILLVSPVEELTFLPLDAQLSQSGWTLIRVDNAASARAYLHECGLPYLVIVDLRLPNSEGLTLCEELYDFAGLPTIALSRDDTSQKEALAALGCTDDYLRRADLSPKELAMRVRRILSRVHDFSYTSGPHVPITDWLSYSPVDSRVPVHGAVKNLTPIENGILLVLLTHRGKVVDATILLERVWRTGEITEEKNALRVHIHRLRQKIEQDPDDPQLVLTARGQGYIMAIS